MPKPLDVIEFINKKFGKLLVVEDLGRSNGCRRVRAICDCGNIKIIKLSSIMGGITQSCGCLIGESVRKRLTKHGLNTHPLYKVWMAMKDRCNNKKNKSYKNYGGRGVKVSIRWENDFEAFYKWCINNGWRKGMDVDKDIKSSTGRGVLYCPELCSIVPRGLNLRSKGNNIILEFNGEKRCVAEWCEHLNIPRSRINYRIRKGWEIDKILTP
jgi:hypothetical protein